jgi:hypothetical protein
MNGHTSFQNWFSMMMELMLNELSITPRAKDKYEAYERIKIFKGTAQEAVRQGFLHIRSHYGIDEIKIVEGYSLFDWMKDEAFPRNEREFFWGLIQPPFIDEDDTDIEERYIKAHYYYEDIKNGFIKISCLGLAAAFLYDTLSISFQNGNYWNRNIIDIIIETEEENSAGKIRNVHSKECFFKKNIADYIINIKKIELIETDITPAHKSIRLAGTHHGSQELQAFWNKLKNCPFVVEVRSAPFDRSNSKFIGKIEPDGKKGVVIVVVRPPFTLWVQTTGRNYRETSKIAEIIQHEYF